VTATASVRRVEAPRPRATGNLGAARRQRDVGAAHRQPAPPPAPSTRPDLRIVPKPRAAVNAAFLLGIVVAVLMLGTVVLHTRLAQRQVEIDRLEQSVEETRARFDVLRQQRAELRAPTRLAIAASELGMMPSPRTEFLPVDPMTVARVFAAAGTVDEVTGTVEPTDPLDQIRAVKAAGVTAAGEDAG
jgi:cell division protein FtsL